MQLAEAITTRSLRSSASSASRGVPITYTLAAGVVCNRCATTQTDDVESKIGTALKKCTATTSYDWMADPNWPSYTQKLELCTCVDLIRVIQTVIIPPCCMDKGGQYVGYGNIFEEGLDQCDPKGGVAKSLDSSGSADNEVPAVTTAAPPPIVETPTPTPSPEPTTTAPPVATPTSRPSVIYVKGDNSSVPTTMWVVISILAAVLLLVVVVALFAFRSYKKRGHATKTTSGQDPVLSPLGDSYVAVASTPPTSSASTYDQKKQHTTRSTASGNGGGIHHNPQQQQGMWTDPAITAARIPYSSIFFGPLLSRGGFGEVYQGNYMGETVAIKQLLPARRKDLAQIETFLVEIKMLLSFDHERIVHGIGVAWNSLSTVCVVVEYMANGDLRSTLSHWETHEQLRPQGFDGDKTKIAMHIAHALTYLHSLQPVIVHRDLKSKNIVLSEEYDAKLTDFGVSREQEDVTMTAGVGTSLWMAPEVMMGKRYDEKADVFSFGVVLSELDTHQMPYSHALDAETNMKMPHSAILQMVAMGTLMVQFTDDSAHPDLVRLGYECVQVDPTKRPTSSEVLHRVHQVWRQYESYCI